MKHIPLYRNIRARDQLDIFLVSAITSLLGLRFYLKVTGYPQVGTGSLHIAHMLWGGMFMMIAITICLSFIGMRAQRIAALIGGVGFGVFIDELGKFITKDNNYFFQPTIGLIYAIFVVLYLVFNFLTKDTGLTSREYQLNAVAQLEEAIAYNLDDSEKRQVLDLLNRADQKSSITRGLRRFVETIEISAAERPSRLHELFQRADKAYASFWGQKRSSSVVRGLFIVQSIALFLSILITTYSSIDDVKLLFDSNVSYGDELIIGQFLSATVAGLFVLYGLFRLTDSRVHAFEQFRRSVLINIYLTEFFVFSRIQFQALPGLAVNLLLLGLIAFVLREERRLQKI